MPSRLVTILIIHHILHPTVRCKHPQLLPQWKSQRSLRRFYEPWQEGYTRRCRFLAHLASLWAITRIILRLTHPLFSFFPASDGGKTRVDRASGLNGTLVFASKNVESQLSSPCSKNPLPWDTWWKQLRKKLVEGVSYIGLGLGALRTWRRVSLPLCCVSPSGGNLQYWPF